VKKVAILVPTKDRLDFVIRLINYYVSINSPHPIFIGDASNKSSEELVLKTAQDKVDIYYFHWEKLNDRKTMIKLAEEAYSSNISSYCAFHGDDDFFISESLSKCADFLNENPEYATSQGRAFTFALNKNGPYGELEKIGKYWNENELNGSTALDRLKEISSSYWVPIFSVHRVNEFIDDIGNGVDSIIDRNFGEYSNSLTIAMRGKSKFIDCLYLARNVHTAIDHPTTVEWITGENWFLSYNELIKSVSKVLSNNDNLSLAESNSIAKLAVDKLISKRTFRHTSTYQLIRKKFLEYTEKRDLLYKLSIFYRRIKYLSISVFFLLIAMTKSPKSKYFKDVSFIVNSCKKSKYVN
jgi:glycosyltransferase domain-containing protein